VFGQPPGAVNDGLLQLLRLPQLITGCTLDFMQLLVVVTDGVHRAIV
jgi:hypothetical protein